MASVFLAGCGDNKPSGSSLVWCVTPDESGVVETKGGYVTKVTPDYAREYPELHMSRAACDAIPN